MGRMKCVNNTLAWILGAILRFLKKSHQQTYFSCRTISTLELRHIMSNLGEKLKESEIDEMILHSDGDGDGIVHCNEWVNLMTSL